MNGGSSCLRVFSRSDAAVQVFIIPHPCGDAADHPDDAGGKPDAHLSKAHVLCHQKRDGEPADHFHDPVE